MPIKIEGRVAVDAPREEVWNLLFDLQVMNGVLSRVPGIDIERLDQIDEMHYEGTATIGVASVKGKYNGTITILEKQPPEFIRLKGEGKGGGNFTSGTLELRLAEEGTGTQMQYQGIGNINGPLASMGQRLMDTIGRQFVDQGARSFAQEIAARHREKQAPVPAPVPLTPIPAPRPTVFPSWAFAAAVAGMLALVIIVYLILQHA